MHHGEQQTPRSTTTIRVSNMDVLTLYRYEREPGKVTISTQKPECEYTTQYRLVAGAGRDLLSPDGMRHFCCADVLTVDGWSEIDSIPMDEEENQDEAE